MVSFGENRRVAPLIPRLPPLPSIPSFTLLLQLSLVPPTLNLSIYHLSRAGTEPRVLIRLYKKYEVFLKVEA